MRVHAREVAGFGRRPDFQNTDAAVPGLNRAGALKLPIQIPPFDLALDFHKFARPIQDLIDKTEEANATLAASRDLLLPRLISGELSVADAPTPARLLEAAD